MNRINLAVLSAFSCALFFCGPAMAKKTPVIEQTKDIVIPADKTQDGDISVSNASVLIKGTLNGNCEVMSGTVAVSGVVRGEIKAMNSRVTISGSAEKKLSLINSELTVTGLVTGGVSAIDSKVLVPGGKIHGLISHLNSDIKSSHGGQARSMWNPVQKFSVKDGMQFLSMTLLCGFIAALGLLTMPVRTEKLCEKLTMNFWKTTGKGALALLAVVACVLGMIFLRNSLPWMQSVINWSLILLSLAVALFGIPACCTVAGAKVLGLAGKPLASLWLRFGVGYAFYTLLAVIGNFVGNPYGGDVLKIGGFFIILYALASSIGVLLPERKHP